MKQLLHILMLASITLYSVSGVVLWGGYFLRADVIARTSCVNPDIPTCHGKCHITELTKSHRDTNDKPPLVELNIEKPLLFFHSFESTQPESSAQHFCYPSDHRQVLLDGFPQNIFHPPLHTA